MNLICIDKRKTIGTNIETCIFLKIRVNVWLHNLKDSKGSKENKHNSFRQVTWSCAVRLI